MQSTSYYCYCIWWIFAINYLYLMFHLANTLLFNCQIYRDVSSTNLSFSFLELMSCLCFFIPYICHIFFFVHLSFNLLYHTWTQIGNAAYHNDLLYEELRRSIPQLANLLQMAEEDKTKANAAGALSNLVRNSDKLCEDIVCKGAVQVNAYCIFLNIVKVSIYAAKLTLLYLFSQLHN